MMHHRIASGLPALLLLGLGLGLGLAGCAGPPRPALPAHTPAPAELLAAEAPARSLKGRANVRLEVEDRDLPVLALAFSVREAQELAALVRPGVLSPVLSLWAAPAGWSLHLPRERAVFASGPDVAEDAWGARIGRVAWWMLVPEGLLADLSTPVVTPGEGVWVVRGRLAGSSDTVWIAEIRLEPETRAVVEWSVSLPDSTPSFRVAYSPARKPGALGRSGNRIHFRLEPLDVTGTLTIDHVRSSAIDALPRPPVPYGWRDLPAEDLVPALERLRRDPEGG